MMSSFQRDLRKKHQYLVQLLRRPLPYVFGFVVDSSDQLVLVHCFDSEAFHLNGYAVIRQKDIRSYCFFDDPRYWRLRAIRRLKIKPVIPPGICLESVPELLRSISRRYPLLSVHHETRDRRVTYVGPIVGMAERSFTIQDADYYGEWTGARWMRYVDTTLVCFDGGYLNASAMTSRRLPKKP
jgi:hypothetical protein